MSYRTLLPVVEPSAVSTPKRFCITCLHSRFVICNLYECLAKRKARYQCMVTGKWLQPSAPLCYDVNPDGKCLEWEQRRPFWQSVWEWIAFWRE